MADIKQKINDLRDEIARLEKKAKSEDTAQKVVIGGMLLSLARKNKDITKMTLAWIDENVGVSTENGKNRAVRNFVEF